MSVVAGVLGVVSAFVTIVVGILALRRHFVPERQPQIISPLHGSENGGRRLAMSGVIPNARSGTHYWIAIQPSDCRSNDSWYPQRKPLTLNSDGMWTLVDATLGRELTDGGQADVGKTYTVALFEVPSNTKAKFKDDICIVKPAACRILHAIDIRRVGY